MEESELAINPVLRFISARVRGRRLAPHEPGGRAAKTNDLVPPERGMFSYQMRSYYRRVAPQAGEDGVEHVTNP